MDRPAAFTDEELRACADGKCCRCGKCCTVYKVHFVPIMPGQPGLAVKKPAGERCWQLAEDTNGRFRCLLHEKGKPFVCAHWNGANQRDEHDPTMKETNYENLRDVDARWIVAPYQCKDVAVIQDDLARGVYSSDMRALAREYCHAQPVRTIRKYVVEYEMIPDAIFTFLDLKGAIAASGYSAERFIGLLSLHEQNPVHRDFMENYLGWKPSTLSPFVDPEHVFSAHAPSLSGHTL